MEKIVFQFDLSTTGSDLLLLLGRSHELDLLLRSLEAAMTELGGSVDELELDLLLRIARGLHEQRLAQGDDALLNAGAAAPDHHVVLVDDTVMREATERSNSLLGKIEFGRGIVVDNLALGHGGLADAVDLLVDLGTVEVTLLTSTSDGERHTGRMPGTDTTDLAQTLVCLARELGDTITLSHALHTMTLGGGADVDHLVLREHVIDRDLLLEHAECVVNLVRNAATVHLDLHEVRLLLAELELADLRVGQDTDDGAVLLDACELLVDRLLVISPLLGIAGESLLL